MNFFILVKFFFCDLELVRDLGKFFFCFGDIEIFFGNVIEFLWGVEMLCFVFIIGGGVERRIVGFFEGDDSEILLFLLFLWLWILCFVLWFFWFWFLFVECFKFFMFEVLGFLLNWKLLVNGIFFCFKCWIYFCLMCFLWRLMN